MTKEVNTNYFNLIDKLIPPSSIPKPGRNLLCFYQKNIAIPLETAKKYWENRATELYKTFFTQRNVRLPV
ncbi:MAG TPA: hypothetical protein DCE71_00780 [Parachlamydiales bacterium]|nr:hypothetical protein [Parachlamydiales bacterium]